jgi:ubiquitin-protein ligase
VPQIISGPDDTPYEGGLYTATLSFPKTYPNAPPKMQFTCDMYHPNIYPDGTVCECHRLRAYVRVCEGGWLVRWLVGWVGSCILLR